MMEERGTQPNCLPKSIEEDVVAMAEQQVISSLLFDCLLTLMDYLSTQDSR
jgi:hypothetical protein